VQGDESFGRTSLARGFAILCVALMVVAPARALAAPVETVLHFFTGNGDVSPDAGLIADSDGNFFGTTSGDGQDLGAVFKLSLPATAGGAWTETVLHAFTGGSDGGSPQAGLIADSKGNLYGTTAYGGASKIGTVFKLSPPATAGDGHPVAGGLLSLPIASDVLRMRGRNLEWKGVQLASLANVYSPVAPPRLAPAPRCP